MFVTGCIRICQNDNCGCSDGRNCAKWQNHISVSLMPFGMHIQLKSREISIIQPCHYDIYIHWKQKVVNLTILSSPVAQQVVVMTTYGATSDDKVVRLTTFCFQCHSGFNRWKFCVEYNKMMTMLAPWPFSVFSELSEKVTDERDFARFKLRRIHFLYYDPTEFVFCSLSHFKTHWPLGDAVANLNL